MSLEDMEFVKVPWKIDNVNIEAGMLILIPDPHGGVIIVGAESITYHNGTNYHTMAPPKI